MRSRDTLISKNPPAFPPGGWLPLGGRASIAFGDTLPEPVLYFLVNPPDPADAEPYPPGEQPGRLKAGYVSGAVEYLLPHLLLR